MLREKYKHVVIIFMFCFCFHDAGATLRTVFMEDLCSFQSTTTYDLRYRKTGILMATLSDEFLDCELILIPKVGSSVVLSIYSYNILEGDSLTIKDADQYKISLIGSGEFPDEKKSIISDGSLVIHYVRNNSAGVFMGRQSLQFTFTQVNEYPCISSEFKCRNHKCVANSLICDGHNHCGDNSDQESCIPFIHDISPTDRTTVTVSGVKASPLAWIICISIAATVVVIIIIVFTVILVRRSKRKKKQGPQQGAIGLQTVTAQRSNQPFQLSPNNLQNAALTPVDGVAHSPQRPSLFGQIRRSLRIHNSPKVEETGKENQKSESYQVPSMYPNLDQPPTAPELDGVTNPNFKMNE